MSKPVMQRRLERQLKQKGFSPAMAPSLMEKAGNMKNGKLTPQGEHRQSRGNAGRAQDRAAKYNGGKASDYKYNSKTNIATKKK